MDSPNLVNRGAPLSSGTRATKGGDTGRAVGGQTTAFGSTGAGSGTVLALLDAASRQRHFGSGQSFRQSGEAETPSPTSTGNESGVSATTAGGPSVDPRASQVTQQFQQNFADTAADHDEFHGLMRQAFGENYNYAAAESIRHQTLAGDFSWMPDVQVVDARTLVDESGRQTAGTALGAYSADTDTIYISSDVLENDPARALEIMTEEVGHGLDARLNETDSAGDEGDIFARLMAGDELSQEELTALRAENDSGTITVDGQEIEVEYGSNPVKAFTDFVSAPFRAMADAFQTAFNSFCDFCSDMWAAVKEVVVKVLNHPIFNALLLICSFIPALNLVVAVIQIVKAVYMIAQGIKHGSMAMVLGGIASLATGVANVGAAMGASAKFIETATKVADWANAAAKTYQAASQQDFEAAFSILADTFSGTTAGTAFGHASTAYSTYEAVSEGDVLGALNTGAQLMGELSGGDMGEFFEGVEGHVETIATVVEAVDSGDYSAAAGILMANYGDTVGLSADQQATVTQVAGTLELLDGARQMIDDGNFAGAALALYAAADEYGVGGEAKEALLDAAETVSKIADMAMLVERGEYGEAIALGASILDSDPSPEMQAHVDKLVAQAERVENVIEAVESGDYTVALGMITESMGMPLSEGTRKTLENLEVRIEAGLALKEAIEDGDIGEALAAFEALTGVELPKLADKIEGLENVAEAIAQVKEAVQKGEFDEAAEIIGLIADGIEDRQLEQLLRSFATLLKRLETTNVAA